MKCLNTIVFYENKEEVKSYITEVASIANGLVDIALIINSDIHAQVPELVKELHIEGIECFCVIDHGENVGYLNALLKTIQSIDVKKYDFFILSNTDIQYGSNVFFQKLFLSSYSSSIGCIAPCVYATISKSYSNPHYLERIPKRKLRRLVRIFRYPALASAYLKLADLKARKARNRKQSSCYAYSPHGCYMIFTREFIQRIMGYEYGVKMYSEESAVGELLRKNGMLCYYDDRLSVIHQESSVTGKLNQKKRFSAWRESLEYILQEFY